MPKKLLVSIIVPIYNVEKYIGKCIESLINQDYDNIEIILVVDGSPDSSLKICEEYAKNDNRIIVIDKENGGVSSARNCGLNKAIGDYIVFVDGDDWLETNFVSYMVDNMKKMSCDFGLSLNSIKNDDLFNEEEHIEVISAPAATALLLSTRVDVGCWNKIYKRSLLTDNNIKFNEKQYYGEGLLFITTVAQYSTKTFTTTKELYHYRQDNLSSATKKYKYDKYLNGESSLDIIKDNLMYDDDIIYKWLNIHYCLFFSNAVYDTYINKQKKAHKEKYIYWKKQVKKYYKIIKKYKELPRKNKIIILLTYYCPAILHLIRKVKNH